MNRDISLFIQNNTMHREFTTREERLRASPAINSFITNLIHYHYDPTSTPAWVNYQLFFHVMFNDMLRELIEWLDSGSDRMIAPGLGFAYISDWIDPGASAIRNATEDDFTIEIPNEVITEYQRLSAT